MVFQTDQVSGRYWQWVIDVLRVEAYLYLPSQADLLLLADGDLRRLFQDLWQSRHRFVQGPQLNQARFRVSTYCRMRPATPKTTCVLTEISNVQVQLPLSQRVAILRQRDPSVSKSEALKQLLSSTWGADHGHLEEEGENANVDLPGQQPVAVPRGESIVGTSERGQLTASVLSVSSHSVVTVSPCIGLRSWPFATVFDEASSQLDVFRRCGLPLAMHFVNGQSGALIAYGQTGGGKTHTVFGAQRGDGGLVPRVANVVLAAVEARRSCGFSNELGVSYVEVFGNDVTNLLGGDIAANRGEAQRMGHRYVLEGHCEEVVSSHDHFQSLLRRGEESKRSAQTAMNDRSTRAHSIVILRLRQQAPGETKRVESMLSLVDLGGSERVQKSKANENICAPGAINVGNGETARVSWVEYYKSRERITETAHINKGLLTLKRCVDALNERQRCLKEGTALPRIPFQDSKLTLLLQPTLDGDSRTTVLVCCSKEQQHAEETVQSLRFAELCGSVERASTNNVADVDAAVSDVIHRLDADLKEVEAEIRRKERWEWQRAVRVDVVDEKNTGGTLCNKDEAMELGGLGAVEILADDGTSKKQTIEHEVWSQVLVGAEAENARRNELLKSRQALLGEQIGQV